MLICLKGIFFFQSWSCGSFGVRRHFKLFWVKVMLEGWRMLDKRSKKKKKKKDVDRRLAWSSAVVPVPSQECRPFCRFCCCKMVQPDRRHNTATPGMMLSRWVCVCVTLTYTHTHTHSSGMHGLGRAPRQHPPAFHFPLSSKVTDTPIFFWSLSLFSIELALCQMLKLASG